MTIQFRKATKKQSRLRLAIEGPSGSGKTYTALSIATHLGDRVAVIDTERGSSDKYSDIFNFDVVNLDEFHPDSYIAAITAAEDAGYEVLIVDSITHEWNSKNGILELHEEAVKKQKTKNSYTAWAEVTPLHTRFIEAIVRCKCHIITTMRSKVDYVQEDNERGGKHIRKVGMAPIQREGMDYEHDVVMDLDIEHNGVITKTRCVALDGKVIKKPGKETAAILKAWLTDGAPEPEPKAPAVDPAYAEARESILAEMADIYVGQGKTSFEWVEYRDSKGLADKSCEDLEVTLASWQKKAAKAKTQGENGQS